MKRAVEFILFLGVAGGLHLAGFAQLPAPEGSQAAGQAGQATASVKASTPALAEMVEQWERPPEAVEEVAPPEVAPPVPDTALQRPRETMAAPERPVMGAGLALPQVDAAPDASISATPPPPPKAEPKLRLPKARPKARPERKTATPKPKAPARKATRASGAGGGANAGNADTPRAATLSQGQIQSLVAQWGAKIRRKIERRKRYPSAARGAAGTVTLRITVSRGGGLQGVSVARSSGHRALDAAALRAVKAAGRFPAAPNGLGQSRYSFTLGMQFTR
ncbi:energy transducer TonB [Roseovarius sp. MMSF_3281]|uniref:energy transducer TonB family protein n=1 Tax=Roseovarius sp. MMSF_3281 TaxID=3046694 RepID=UPI00273D38AF|nr:TonB family protein [Roseovarius sp. MMSF_3281]